MAHVPVTLLYGSLVALLLAGLGGTVSLARMRGGVGVTTVPSGDLLRLVRAHGNCAEWAPMLVLLLAGLELSGVGPLPLHVLGGSVLLARLLHAGGTLFRSKASVVGASLTYLLMVVMPVYGLVLHFRA